MKKLLLSNKELLSFLNSEQIEESFTVDHHIGNAPERGKKLVEEIKSILKKG
jgi:adenylosuccinate lyase